MSARGAGGVDDAELAVVAFEEHAAAIARLRSRALAVPTHVLSDATDWRAPIAQALRSAEVVARLGGRPADGDSVAAHEDAVLAIVQSGGAAHAAARPHDDPQPARRIARRILQRLHGMGKWGGYHTEFRHLARGFAGNERALADEVGEALLARRPARGEAERRPAPRLPQPAPCGRHPRADRPRRCAARTCCCRRFARRSCCSTTSPYKSFTVRTLVKCGMFAPTRPDRLALTLKALRQWGPSAAAGYSMSAIRYPDRVALIDELGALTFVEMQRRTNALAHAWSDEGIGEGDVVAILCRNHRGLVEALVACSKLGAHALFLNTAFSAPQLQEVCALEGVQGDRPRRGVRAP